MFANYLTNGNIHFLLQLFLILVTLTFEIYGHCGCHKQHKNCGRKPIEECKAPALNGQTPVSLLFIGKNIAIRYLLNRF